MTEAKLMNLAEIVHYYLVSEKENLWHIVQITKPSKDANDKPEPTSSFWTNSKDYTSASGGDKTPPEQKTTAES